MKNDIGTLLRKFERTFNVGVRPGTFLRQTFRFFFLLVGPFNYLRYGGDGGGGVKVDKSNHYTCFTSQVGRFFFLLVAFELST